MSSDSPVSGSGTALALHEEAAPTPEMMCWLDGFLFEHALKADRDATRATEFPTLVDVVEFAKERASALRWLVSQLPELLKDRDRLEYVFEEIAARHRDDETQEVSYRLDWETGWCASYRAAIDADAAQFRDDRTTPAALPLSQGEGRS